MSVSRLLLGTRNETKISHYKKFLHDLPFQIITAADLNLAEPPETGSNLEENAAGKAEYYFQKSGLPTLSDDGGFEIPALANFPGVNSNRFAGHRMSDEEIINGIIEKMAALKGRQRAARYKVVLALKLSPTDRYTASGQIEGEVPEIPYEKIIPHFPYRSLLYITALNKWFYDLTEEEEERFGYRKAAMEKLKPYLI